MQTVLQKFRMQLVIANIFSCHKTVLQHSLISIFIRSARGTCKHSKLHNREDTIMASHNSSSAVPKLEIIVFKHSLCKCMTHNCFNWQEHVSTSHANDYHYCIIQSTSRSELALKFKQTIKSGYKEVQRFPSRYPKTRRGQQKSNCSKFKNAKLNFYFDWVRFTGGKAYARPKLPYCELRLLACSTCNITSPVTFRTKWPHR